NKPRTATGSRTSRDKLTNSRSGATGIEGKYGGSSSDCLRCQRNTSRSWNDGAHFPTHLWRQKRDAAVVRQPHLVFHSADRDRLPCTLHRYRLGSHGNAGG